MHYAKSGHSLHFMAAMLTAIGVLTGHIAPIFFKFRGGKGIAMTIGALMAIMPNSAAIGVFVWLVMFYATKIVSVASLCFALSIPLTTYLFRYSPAFIAFAFVLGIIIFWRHRDNIVRLANGSEYKFAEKVDFKSIKKGWHG
jgi:glycerol-3-phosphate acyltransferase PlsY